MNYFDSQTLTANGTTAVVVYSPWYPRGGDHGIQTLEVVAIIGGTIKVEIYHKLAEDAGDGSLMGTGTQSTEKIERTSAGRTSLEFNDAAIPATYYPYKEVWRYKFTFTPTSGTQSVTFRMLPVAWYDALKF